MLAHSRFTSLLRCCDMDDCSFCRSVTCKVRNILDLDVMTQFPRMKQKGTPSNFKENPSDTFAIHYSLCGKCVYGLRTKVLCLELRPNFHHPSFLPTTTTTRATRATRATTASTARILSNDDEQVPWWLLVLVLVLVATTPSQCGSRRRSRCFDRFWRKKVGREGIL